MRIRDAIAPYTRFVRGEVEKLEKIENDTTAIVSEIRTLRHKIGGEDRAISGYAGRRPVNAPLPTQAIAPRSGTTLPPVIEMPAPADEFAPPTASDMPIEVDSAAPPIEPEASSDANLPAPPERKLEAISPDDV
jgi:hypothetical protein